MVAWLYGETFRLFCFQRSFKSRTAHAARAASLQLQDRLTYLVPEKHGKVTGQPDDPDGEERRFVVVAHLAVPERFEDGEVTDGRTALDPVTRQILRQDLRWRERGLSIFGQMYKRSWLCGELTLGKTSLRWKQAQTQTQTQVRASHHGIIKHVGNGLAREEQIHELLAGVTELRHHGRVGIVHVWNACDSRKETLCKRRASSEGKSDVKRRRRVRVDVLFGIARTQLPLRTERDPAVETRMICAGYALAHRLEMRLELA